MNTTIDTMGRFIAVQGDDGISRIHDEETGEFLKIEFHDPGGFDCAWGCAKFWNHLVDARDKAMEDWFKL